METQKEAAIRSLVFSWALRDFEALRSPSGRLMKERAAELVAELLASDPTQAPVFQRVVVRSATCDFTGGAAAVSTR